MTDLQLKQAFNLLAIFEDEARRMESMKASPAGLALLRAKIEELRTELAKVAALKASRHPLN